MVMSGDELLNSRVIGGRATNASKSSSDRGGSNSANTSKEYSQFNFGEIAQNNQRIGSINMD
jgi:hypothetical protein